MNSSLWRIQLVRETLQLETMTRLGVRDHGTGVRPTDQKPGFKLFGRGMADATVGGLAWGLRLAKKVAHRHGAAASVPGEDATIFARSTERTVMTTATDGHLSNETAPDFTLPGGDGRPVALRDHRGHNLILAFYPADWSPVCGSELALFQEVLGEIRGRNAEILGISVDNSFSHRAYGEAQHLTFPLLADFWPHGAVAKQYGVFRDGDGVAQRSLFFIDAAGIVQSSWVSGDQAVAPGLDVVFEALDRLEGVAPGQENRRV